jgi:hypothetical protein
MASYIPASYAGRDFATRPAAHDQRWSNDDCLSSDFITDGRKGFARLRKEMGTERPAQGNKPAKPPMDEYAIETRISEIKQKRKEVDKKRKANKAVHAAGGVPGMSHAELKAERALRQEVLTQATQAYKEAQESGADQATLGEAKIRMLKARVELAKLNPGQGAGNTSGKKKKKRVKVPLSEDERTQLMGIVSRHTMNVRNALEATTHAEYSARLHEEFVNFAGEKLQFYNSLADSPGRQKKIAVLQEIYDKIKGQRVDDTFWPLNVFSEFKQIMTKYRRNVDELLDKPYTSKVRREKRKELLHQRTIDISTLLKDSNITIKKEADKARR